MWVSLSIVLNGHVGVSMRYPCTFGTSFSSVSLNHAYPYMRQQYQLTFEPNVWSVCHLSYAVNLIQQKPNWSSFYAPGPEIQRYIEHVAHKWKLQQYINLEHEVLGSIWDDKTGKWTVNVKCPQGEFADTADIVINCIGNLSQWNWPDIEGLHDFQGNLVHSAQWDLEPKDGKEPWEGKNVAVIGVVPLHLWCDCHLVNIFLGIKCYPNYSGASA